MQSGASMVPVRDDTYKTSIESSLTVTSNSEQKCQQFSEIQPLTNSFLSCWQFPRELLTNAKLLKLIQKACFSTRASIITTTYTIIQNIGTTLDVMGD